MKENSSQKTLEWKTPTTIWNPMFLSVFFASAALNLSQQMSNSLLSLYAKANGAPADQIGSLMSMFAITALIFRFISGPAMNAFNRKRLLQMSMCFFVTAYLGFSFAPAISAATGIPVITVLKCFRLLQGIGNAFGNSCLLTIVSDCLPKDKFTSGMGFYACAQTVSQALGSPIGVFLRDHFGYNTTYIIVACLMTCAIILVSLVVRTAPRTPTKFKLTPKNMVAKEALIPAGVTFLIAIGFTTINSFLLVYSEERGISNGSFFFTVYAVTMLATRPIVGKLTDKFGFVKVSIPAVFMTAASLFLIGQAHSTITLLVAAVVNAFGYGAVQPALQSLCMKSVVPERRGSASGTNYIAQDAATIVGPRICGWVANAAGYTPTMWNVMTIPVLLGIVFIVVFRNRINTIESEFAQRNATQVSK